MRVLAIDTAGPVLGVAAWDDGRVAVRVARAPRGTEGRLPELVREVCAELGVGVADLERIGVAEGPGAFTGLRVGLAAAAGLAEALGIGVVPVDSLETRARRVGGSGTVLAWLDARKGRVYAEVWRDGQRSAGPDDIAPEAALVGLPPGFRATGEGALVYSARVLAAGGSVVAEADHPAVDVLASLTAAREPIDPIRLTPRYLRAPDAVPPGGIGSR